jgi:prevent-host-death family protein
MDVAVSEPRAHLSDYLDRARAGDEVVITDRGVPVARLLGLTATATLERLAADGINVQAICAPDGFPLWVYDAGPGSVHDITAARGHALPALYRGAAAGLPTLADPGYEGAGIGILILVKQSPGGGEPDVNTRIRNAVQRSLRCLGERGFALLNQHWRTLQHVTASPSKIGDIARAALVLTHFEHGYLI